jgi:putative ABC transport system permease protein
MRTGISLLDLKLGLRMLVKHPGLTLVGGIGMAVAIAMSVGMFAFLRAHTYPELPLQEGGRIVALENRDVEVNNEERQSLHDFLAWREQMRSVEDLAAFRTIQRNLITGEGPPELVQLAEMTAAGFRVARVPPLMGRYLVEEDERAGAPQVVVIGHEVWRTRFARDPAIIGRDIRLGSTVHTVVGVMPEGFTFPMSHQFWTPLRADPSAYERREGPGSSSSGDWPPT